MNRLMSTSLLSRLGAFILGSTVFFSCSSKSGNEASKISTDTIAAVDTVTPEAPLKPVHPYYNSIMNYISGRKGSEIAFGFDSAFFAEYASTMDSVMGGIEQNRLSKVRSWYSGVLQKFNRNDTLPVFYPFSGGDFLHINTMYPKTPDIVMMAIEKVGYFPDLDSMSREDKNTLLRDVRHNMRDIFHKSYFITRNMQADLRSKKLITGMILPIFWGIGVSGHEILDVKDASIDNSGKVILSDINGKVHKFEKGVHIVFRKKGDRKERTLTYFAVDISDKGFESDTALTKYLAAKPVYNSFLKAASYLPHYGSFSNIRNNILEKTQNHVQDDTGIPYKYFVPEKFTARVFGHYTTPVSDFSTNLFQRDLDAAYHDSVLYGGRLDFSMGYHWASSEQNEMVFMRK